MFDNVLFFVSAFMTVAGAVMVVLEKNLMHACIFLLLSLIGTAGLYLTLNADFIAATQLVVYVGGVVILMLFAIMLTGGGLESRKDRLSNLLDFIPPMGNVKSYSYATVTALVFLWVSYSIVDSAPGLKNLVQEPTGFKSTVDEIGTKLLTDHVLMFEMSSVLLLGALVGAALISRPQRSKNLESK